MAVVLCTCVYVMQPLYENARSLYNAPMRTKTFVAVRHETDPLGTITPLELHASASPSVIAEMLRQKTYIHPETKNALDAVNKLPTHKPKG